MPLIEHIRELRRRVLRAMLGLLLGTAVGFAFFDPIWRFLKHPYCEATKHQWVNHRCQLYFHSITEGFFLHLKIAFIVGAVISAPIWLYQLWAFIAPGLYAREKKWTYTFVGAAVPLFLTGAVIAYYTLNNGLRVLLGFAPAGSTALITIDSYLSYLVGMMFVFGLTMELPLLVIILNLAGVLTHERLKKWRRGIIFGIFVFTAITVPSPDPFTMLAIALPTVVAFEVADLISWIHDRRKRAKDPYADLSDDEASPLEPADYSLDG
jgi:sec-independent protein translocase protein TatC